MDKYQFIRELTAAVDEYVQSSPEESLSDFANWLHRKHLSQLKSEMPAGALPDGRSVESEIFRLVVNLNRYAKQYGKRVLEGSGLITLDDFVFLLTALYKPGLTKSEMIQFNIMDMTSGMEVIGRLLRQGLLTESRHPTDKRAMALRITPAGQATLGNLFPRMKAMADVVSGDLSPDERLLLLSLLNRLEDFHRPLFQEKEVRTGDWATVLQKALHRREG